MLHIERITIPNPLRNYNHLVVCTETNEALMLDPCSPDLCIATAEKNGWTITQVVNTHEHNDHICGNGDIVSNYQCPISAPASAKSSIPDVDHWLEHGDTVTVGNITLKVINTPGHTHSHICLYSDVEQPVLLCGDTLFNAGVGNCYSGDAATLFDSVTHLLSSLPDATRIYPGHDYIETNLGFSLDREPDNKASTQLLEQVQKETPDTRTVTTLKMEKQINPFFRLSNASIKAGLQTLFPEMADTDKEVFIHLRKLRDQW